MQHSERTKTVVAMMMLMKILLVFDESVCSAPRRITATAYATVETREKGLSLTMNGEDGTKLSLHC